MNQIFEFFVKNYKLTIILSGFLLIGGLLGLMKLNNESYPAVNFATAIIETRYPGATPQDVETKITKPIEDEVRTVSGLKDVKSTSQSGLSKIIVRLDMDNVDVEDVINDVEKAVERVKDLPEDILEDPKFIEIKSEEFPAIEMAITGSNENRARDIMADQLKEDLEDDKRVLNVRLTGFQERQFNIRLNQEKLNYHHIGVNEVLAQVNSRNQNIPGGELESDNFRKLVRIEGKVKDSSQLENIVLRSNFSGQKVLLKDVAQVIDGEQEVDVLTRFNGEDATLLTVNKKGGADTLALVENVQEVLKRYREQYKGKFEIHIYNNEALKVKNKLDILVSNAVTGLVFVVFFLLIFLPGWVGVVASLSLPLAVMGTLGLMPSFGMNLDSITILALVIALGMLVDNSVVISENFTRLRHEGLSPKDAALTSVSQLWLPVTATAFTTIMAFLPMLVTKGIMGEFIKWIPVVVTVALLLSLFESFLLLPMRLAAIGGFIADKASEVKRNWFDSVIEKFEGWMNICVKYRYLVAVAFGVALVFSFMLMFVFNKFILFPADQTEIYFARTEMIKDTTLEKNTEALAALSKKIEEKMGDDVKFTVARAGTAMTRPDDQKGEDGDHVGMIAIYASDYAKYNIDYTDFLKKLREIETSGFKSVIFEEMVNGPPVGDAINATFRSNNSDRLHEFTEKVIAELGETDGILNLRTDEIIGEDEVFVNINYGLVDRLGLSVEGIGNTIRTVLSGTPISDVTLNNKEVDLHVKMDSGHRKDLDDLKDIKTMDARGNLVPIGQIADFKISEGSRVIKRFDFKRSLTVLGGVDEEKITAFEANKKLRTIYNKYLPQYSDVSLVFGGVEESTKESFESLLMALVLALIGVYAIMVFLFRSFLRPALIMSTIPLGLVGFSIAFYLHQRPVSFLAMIGLIGLAGIIVNSGIVLISFIDELRAEGKLELNEILTKASGLRLRAVVVTSLTTISGLLPTAYGIGGNEAMLIPMTLAMAWGLTSGTILTLVWIPCAYAILEDWLGFFYGLVDKVFKTKLKEETRYRPEPQAVVVEAEGAQS